MEKKVSLEKAIEIFVLITLPIALVVGCEGTLKQRAEIDRTDESLIIEQSYNLKDIYPLFSSDSGNIAVNDIIQKNEQNKSEQLVLTQTELKPVTDSVTSNVKPESAMMNVLFIDDAIDAKKQISSIGDNNTPVLKVARSDEDVLVAGANSTMAYVSNVELQPTYMVFGFDTDKTEVREYDHYYIKQHVSYLTHNPNLLLMISGHADSRGSKVYNEELSMQRATEVYNLMLGYGVPQSQLQLKAHGEMLPVSDLSLSQRDAWRENRRVELNYIDNTLMSAK